MLIKFFPNGEGGGAAPVNYLTARTVLAYDENRDLIRDDSGQPQTVTRDPLPEVLRNHPNSMIDLIDSCRHKRAYKSGVVSFSREDTPSEGEQLEVMDRFEQMAFAGLDGDQFSCLWVRHTHENRVELHFCTPSMELRSGRSLNIAPPGHERSFNSLRDLMNKTHDWADPMDASRAAEVKAVNEAPARAQGREEIHDWIRDQISVGLITDRAEMIEALCDAGFEVPRAGKNYITAKDPDTGEKWRLKGEIFNEDWQAGSEIEREAECGLGGHTGRSSRLDQFTIEELQERFERCCEQRADYNRHRYGATGHEYAACDLTAGTVDVGHTGKDVGEEFERKCAGDSADLADFGGDGAVGGEDWLETIGDRDGGGAASNIHAFDQPEDAADQLPRGDGSNQLHTDWEGMTDGWSDSTRARIAQIRGAVDESLRSVSAGLARLGEAIERSIESTPEWLGRLRVGAAQCKLAYLRCLEAIERGRKDLGFDRRQDEREFSALEPDGRPQRVSLRTAEQEIDGGWEL